MEDFLQRCLMLELHSIPPFTYYWFNSNGDTLKVDSLGSVWYNPSHVATYTNRCAGNYELHAYDFYNNGPVTAQYSLTEPNDIIISNGYNQPLLIECGRDTVLEVAVTGGNLTNDTILLNDVTINIGSPNTPNIFGFSDTLEIGKTYLLEVTGTYSDFSGLQYDAAYKNFNSPIANLDWSFDGNFTHTPVPNSYNTNHKYYYPFIGDGIHELIFFNQQPKLLGFINIQNI